MKQSELAKAAGVSLATLNNIERGVGDPRASTLEAIERALLQAGIGIESDGATETVHLHRLARPSAYETFHASQRILENLSRTSLLKVERILFYVRRDHSAREAVEAQKLCVFLQGHVRSILFDQVSFILATGARAAEIGGILLASHALHSGKLFYVNQLTEDTTLAPLSEAVDRLHRADWAPLSHPKLLIDLFDDWDKRLLQFSERPGHPLLDLAALVGPAWETIKGKPDLEAAPGPE